MWVSLISFVLGIAIIVMDVMDTNASWDAERERYQRERADAASRGPEELERFERKKSMEIAGIARGIEEERRTQQFTNDLARKIGKEISKKS